MLQQNHINNIKDDFKAASFFILNYHN